MGSCINPANGEAVGSYAEAGVADAQAAIDAAVRAFEKTNWSRQPRLRAQVLLDFADRLEARRNELTATLTLVNGKLIRESNIEVTAAVSEFRYYAGLARNLFGRIAEIDAGCWSLLPREAAGVVGIIVPWNAPVTLLARSLAPAIAAGCTVVVKCPHQTSLVTKLAMECFAEVPNVPSGVLSVLHESGYLVSDALVRSPNVNVISFTGSSDVGKRIMASAAPTLKRLSLELGGKAPSIVFRDCDQKKAVAAIAAAATVMAGQMCTAAARILVDKAIAKDIEVELRRYFQDLVVGPGNHPDSQMGPVIDQANRDRVLHLIEAASHQGRMIVRGQALDGELASGAFVSPTLVEIEDVRSSFIQDELFCPLLIFETFSEEQEAIERANATNFGLVASVWTSNLERAHRASRALKYGTVWVNSYNRLFAEAETGGYRDSGFGRLHGLEGLDDFLQTKHVYIEALG
jgi:acyl-CoA reductase-like NAD-dependent aldehyde dehydrogenase